MYHSNFSKGTKHLEITYGFFNVKSPFEEYNHLLLKSDYPLSYGWFDEIFTDLFLQEYINTVRIGHRIHAGVTLATECIQSFSMGGMTNTGPNARRRNVQGSDASRFQLSMINRQSYTSAVAGILSATNLEKTILLSKFCCEVDNTAESAKKKAFAKREMKMFDDAVWKLTASLILMKPSMDERQLFTLTRAPVKLFQADAMQTIVECWNW